MKKLYATLINWVLDHPKLVLAFYVVLAVVATIGTIKIKEEEDLMVFLPTEDPDVKLFRDTAGKFGVFRVALVGLESPPGTDLFAPDALAKLDKVSAGIRDVRGVDRVLSLSTLTHVTPTEFGAEVTPLIGPAPTTLEEARVIRQRVMAQDHVVGQFVSEDGRAGLVMVFLADGAVDKQVLVAVHALVERELAGFKVYYGGAPFAGQAIYQEAQADVWRLSPFAILILLVAIILAYRDPVGVVLTIAGVGIATVVVIGGQGLWGEKFTVATSMLPVILFASGNSYAVHVLGRYYLIRSQKTGKAAIQEALEIVGPPVAIAMATTAAGFFAFLSTDVRPMRAFGIACGFGVFICWLASVTMLPAVLVLWPRSARPSLQLDRFGDALVWLWRGSVKFSLPLLLFGLAATGLLLHPMLKVKVRMEPSAFFRVGGEPWLADRFLNERFGGGTFLQIALRGDFDHPGTLREVARLEDYLATLPNVTQVSSITTPLRLVGEAMGGVKRLPTSMKQAGNLYLFLENEPGVRSLIANGRNDILIQARIRGDARPAVVAAEDFVRKRLHTQPTKPTTEDLAERLAWIAESAGQKHDPGALAAKLALLAPPAAGDVEWTQQRTTMVKEFVASEEAPPADEAQRAQLLAASSDGQAAVEKAYLSFVKDPEEGKDAARRLATRLEDARRVLGTKRAVPVMVQTLGLAGNAKVETRVRQAVDDHFALLDETPARLPLSGAVAGEPILNRGFSRSVGKNTERTLVVSIVVVLLIFSALFRSLKLGLITLIPSVITLVAMLGVMGLFGIDIDLGTSLVAGIATGAGADFAMHYLWYLRDDEPEEVSRVVGPIMVLSILLVAMGFAILGLGKSPVMHLLGILAALSMALSALLTCVFMPALLHRFAPEYGWKQPSK